MIDNDPRLHALAMLSLTRAIEVATAPTADHNFNPRTRPVQYGDVQVGDVIMEQPDYPVVVVTRTLLHPDRVRFGVLYTWQSAQEATWPLGPFQRNTTARKAVR